MDKDSTYHKSVQTSRGKYLLFGNPVDHRYPTEEGIGQIGQLSSSILLLLSSRI
jgi:hypothetical protein